MTLNFCTKDVARIGVNVATDTGGAFGVGNFVYNSELDPDIAAVNAVGGGLAYCFRLVAELDKTHGITVPIPTFLKRPESSLIAMILTNGVAVGMMVSGFWATKDPEYLKRAGIFSLYIVANLEGSGLLREIRNKLATVFEKAADDSAPKDTSVLGKWLVADTAAAVTSLSVPPQGDAVLSGLVMFGPHLSGYLMARQQEKEGVSMAQSDLLKNPYIHFGIGAAAASVVNFAFGNVHEAGAFATWVVGYGALAGTMKHGGVYEMIEHYRTKNKNDPDQTP